MRVHLGVLLSEPVVQGRRRMRRTGRRRSAAARTPRAAWPSGARSGRVGEERARARRRAPRRRPAARAGRSGRPPRPPECRRRRSPRRAAPAPIASTSDSGSPSQSDGITNTSIAASRLPRSRRAPEEVHARRQARALDACVRASSRSSPSPTTSRWTSASAGVVASASNRNAVALLLGEPRDDAGDARVRGHTERRAHLVARRRSARACAKSTAL